MATILCKVGTDEVGNIRYIGADNWSYSIGILRKKGTEFYPPMGEKFAPGFRILFSILKENYGIEPDAAAKEIISTFEKNTGIKMVNPERQKDETVEAFGKRIETTFQCNYNNMKHNWNKDPSMNIKARVLKDVSKED